MKSEIPERYEIISELGTGGMGSVYLALDKILDKKVAIKVLAKTSIADDPRVIQRFQREAMAAGKLAHQNLVSTLDFDVSPSGQPYLVMDYAEGVTLKDHLAAVGALPLDQIHDIFKQILAGIAHAHKEGVVHRDLKTSNIVLVDDEDGKLRAMVIDFGIALILEDGQSSSELTRTNAVLGSPLYMSPEQVRGEKADERSDIYSLGCVLYECLTGSPPFKGESSLQTMEMHLSTPPPEVTGMFGDDEALEARLNRVLSIALAKDPAVRFSRVDLFASALSDAVIEPVIKMDGLAIESSIAASDRRLVVTSIVLAFFLIVGLTSVILMSIFRPDSMEPVGCVGVHDFPSYPASSSIHEETPLLTAQDLKKELSQIDPGNAVLSIRGKRWIHDRFLELRDSQQSKFLGTLSIPFSSFDNPTDIGLLKDLNLTALNLASSNFDDSGAKELKQFKQLRGLKIGGCESLTDEGVREISEISSLTSLEFGGGSKETGDCLKHILKLKDLYALDLKRLKDLKPEQLALLSAMKLTYLFMSNTELSSEELKALAKLKSLIKIKLTSVTLSDPDETGMKELAQLKNLKDFEFYDCKYNLADLRRFHDLNPNCKLQEDDGFKKLSPINLEDAK
ncbi:MAG: protein kinase [Cyanobacteriota/Melainabacteria group bacterium]